LPESIQSNISPHFSQIKKLIGYNSQVFKMFNIFIKQVLFSFVAEHFHRSCEP
jgi:hypothetical protein